MHYSDIGIYFQIVGIVIALGPTKFWIAIRIFEIYLIIHRKEFLKIEENRPPKTFQEKCYKIEMTFKTLQKALKKAIDEWNYKKFLESDLSDTIGALGIFLIIIGLFLQFSYVHI